MIKFVLFCSIVVKNLFLVVLINFYKILSKVVARYNIRYGLVFFVRGVWLNFVCK